jgi:DeoR/GlpR family transcriptional regulator of sugar metabolism
MLQEERLNEIMNILRKRKTMKNEELAAKLFCSISTLRRDLLELEKNGLVRRSHGGVSIVSSSNNEFAQAVREHEQTSEKEVIAQLALDFITHDQALFLDSSSTTYKLCAHLARFNNLIVITNCLKKALLLNNSGQTQVFVTGGELKKNTSSLIGEISSDFLKRFKADIALISCRGISTGGVFEADLGQAMIKQHMIKNARMTVLLVDDSKFDTEYFYLSAGFEEIDAIVTNKKPSEEFLAVLAKYDCEVIY